MVCEHSALDHGKLYVGAQHRQKVCRNQVHSVPVRQLSHTSAFGNIICFVFCFALISSLDRVLTSSKKSKFINENFLQLLLFVCASSDDLPRTNSSQRLKKFLTVRFRSPLRGTDRSSIRPCINEIQKIEIHK